MANHLIKPSKIAFLVHDMLGAGTQRIVLNLLKPLALRQDIFLELVVVNLSASSQNDSFLDRVPSQVKVTDLETEIEHRIKSYFRVFSSLIKYIKREKPHILLSNLPIINVLSIMAKILAGSSARVFLVEHSLFLMDVIPLVHERARFPHQPQGKIELILPKIMRWFYPQADGVIAVSKGLARHIERSLNLKSGFVKVIYNPVIDGDLLSQSKQSVFHPFFESENLPIFLAVGRLTVQKDFETLLQAFAVFRQKNAAKLLILGEGELRNKLTSLVRELNLEKDVCLFGFVKNPYAYMRRATALVLSSVWEGLPTVLIEAMACGCQVISTDCTYGPNEILQQGEYGFLVPVKDVSALAAAMQQSLEFPKNPEKLKQRAQDFTIKKAVSEYLSLMKLS